MKILVTGASGFIGSHLTKRLEADGHEVLGIDVLDGYDIRDYYAVRQAFVFGPDIVFHLAAFHPLRLSELNPAGCAMVNYIGTYNVLLAAHETRAKVVIASTAAVRGNYSKPSSHYGLTKLHAESLARFFNDSLDTETIVVRFSSVYGPGRKEGPINAFLDSARKGMIVIFGDGSTSRDFTHIDDVIDGLSFIARGKAYWGTDYDIATGQETTLNELVDIIRDVTGWQFTVEYKPERKGDIRQSRMHIGNMQILGYAPQISLKTGIERLVRS